jgi:hypothetical protein
MQHYQIIAGKQYAHQTLELPQNSTNIQMFQKIMKIADMEF